MSSKLIVGEQYILPHEAEGCIPLAPVTPRGADAPDVNVPDTSIPAPTKLSEYEVNMLWDSYIQLRKVGQHGLIRDLANDYLELRSY